MRNLANIRIRLSKCEIPRPRLGMTSYICEPVLRTVLRSVLLRVQDNMRDTVGPTRSEPDWRRCPCNKEEGQVENDLASKLKLSAGGSLF